MVDKFDSGRDVSFEDLLSAGINLLRKTGARLVDGGLADLSLVLADRSVVPIEVKVWESTIRLSQTLTNPGTRTLHIVNRASPKIVSAATEGHFDLVTTNPERVIVRGEVLHSTEAAEPRLSSRRGKPPWGRWAIERMLVLNREPLHQQALARGAGVTAQAASQALRGHPHVRRVDGGWTAGPDLLEHWLLEYPGPGGHATYWYGLKDPIDQADAAAGLAAELAVDSLISGDVAADSYAPWRRPSSARLYVREIVDLEPAGFSPTDSHNATLTLVLPKDFTLWPVAEAVGYPAASRPLADPLVVLWDLQHMSSGADRNEAANALGIAVQKKETLA